MNGAGRQNTEEKRVQNNDIRCFYPPLSQYNWRPKPSNLLEGSSSPVESQPKVLLSAFTHTHSHMEHHDGFGGEKFIHCSPMLSFSPHTKPVKHDAQLAPRIPKQILYLTSEHSTLCLHRRSYLSHRLQLRASIVHLNHKWGLVQHLSV